MRGRHKRIVLTLAVIFALGFLLTVAASMMPGVLQPACAQGVFRRGQQGTDNSEAAKEEEEKKKREAEEKARREEEARKAEAARKAEEARKTEEARRAEESRRAEAARARENEERAARDREAAQRAERERIDREAWEAADRRAREAQEREERLRRETETRSTSTIERVEQRPPAPVIPQPNVEPSGEASSTSRSGRTDRVDSHRAPVQRSGTKFERVEERPRPQPPPDYYPRYYPYDYEWYDYYRRSPRREPEIIIIREPEVIVIREPEVVVVREPEPPVLQPPVELPEPAETWEDEEAAPPDFDEFVEMAEDLELPAPRRFMQQPGTPERALEEIERGWLDRDIDLIGLHIDAEVPVRIYRQGKFSHSLDGEEFIRLTADGLDRMETSEFALTIKTRLGTKVFATGMHRYIGLDDEAHRAFITYTLKNVDEMWIIVEAGFARLEPAPVLSIQPGGRSDQLKLEVLP